MIWQKKNWLPFSILIFTIIFGSVLIIVGNNAPVRSHYPQNPITGCAIMQDKGDYDNTVDIVFLGDNYDDIRDFIADTSVYKESFLSVYPYSIYNTSFNFFRIEKFQNLGCTYDEVLLCSPTLVKVAGSACPHDYFVVLSDIDGVKSLFSFLRSSSWMGINVLNTADNKLVFAHEFAHAFGDFADEYTWEGGNINWDAPNCDSEWSTCPKFKVVNDSECHKGCVNEEYSRSVKIGIMRDYWNSERYGVYNEYVLGNILDEKTYLGNKDEVVISRNSPVNILIVSGHCDNTECIIDNVEQKTGYADPKIDDAILEVRNGKHVASLTNYRLYTDYKDKGDITVPENFDFAIVVEKDATEEKIELLDSTDKVIDVYLISPSEENIVFGISKKIFLKR